MDRKRPNKGSNDSGLNNKKNKPSSPPKASTTTYINTTITKQSTTVVQLTHSPKTNSHKTIPTQISVAPPLKLIGSKTHQINTNANAIHTVRPSTSKTTHQVGRPSYSWATPYGFITAQSLVDSRTNSVVPSTRSTIPTNKVSLRSESNTTDTSNTTRPSNNTSTRTTIPTDYSPFRSKLNTTATDTKAVQIIDNHKEQNKQLKLNGRIKISIHGTEVYTDSEMRCILNTLRAKTAKKAGRNLYTAEVSTGTYKHADNTLDPQEIELGLGPQFDQATQVNEKQIMNEIFNKKSEDWLRLVTIPALVSNPKTIPATTKPETIHIPSDNFINLTKQTIPEEIIFSTLLNDRLCGLIFHEKSDFQSMFDNSKILNNFMGDIRQEKSLRMECMDHILDYEEKDYYTHGTETLKFLKSSFERTIEFSTKNPNTVLIDSIIPEHKVLIQKDCYINMIENILRNRDTFVELRSEASSTAAFIKRNEKVLKKLCNVGLINAKQMQHAVHIENKKAKLYGILDKSNNVIIKLNTELSMGILTVKTLVGLIQTDRTTKYDFVINEKSASNMIFLPDETLARFSVKMIPQNIPREEITRHIFKNQNHLKLETINLMKEILDLFYMSSEFTFNEKTFKQIKGMKPDNILWPVVSKIMINNILDEVFSSIDKPKLILTHNEQILMIIEKPKLEGMLINMNRSSSFTEFKIIEQNNDKMKFANLLFERIEWSLKIKSNASQTLFKHFLNCDRKKTIWRTLINDIMETIKNTEPQQLEELITALKHTLTQKSYNLDYIKKAINTAKSIIELSEVNINLDHNETFEHNKPPFNNLTPRMNIDLTQT